MSKLRIGNVTADSTDSDAFGNRIALPEPLERNSGSTIVKSGVFKSFPDDRRHGDGRMRRRNAAVAGRSLWVPFPANRFNSGGESWAS